MVGLTATSCADASETSRPASSTPDAATSERSPSPEAEVDLVALIESIQGYTYAPAPDVEQALASAVGKVEKPMVVRAVLLNGERQGVVIISVFSDDGPVSDQDLRNFLAGAVEGGNDQGTATRSEIAGSPGVRSVQEDGGQVAWSAVKGRYTVQVAAVPALADDLTRQVLERLPG
jgi:hypothetical protein